MKRTLLKTLLLACLLSVWGANCYAATLEDKLTLSFFGVSGTSYTTVSSKTADSGTVYGGTLAGGNSSIQLRNNSSGKAGIFSTSSIGYVRKVTVAWNSNTDTSRTLNIYGSNTAYSEAADLYDSSKQGTLIGTIDHSANQTEVSITGDYAYVGIAVASGALYLDEIDITWETTDEGYIPMPNITPASGTYTSDQTVTMTANEGYDIYYTINDGTETQYTEPFVLNENGTYVIAAYATDGTNKSETNTVTIIINETAVSTCADLRKLSDEIGATSASASQEVEFKFEELLVTGAHSNDVFVQDNTGSYFFYGSNAKSLKKGDKISGYVLGNPYAYYTVRELQVSDSYANISITSSGNEVTPQTVTIKDVTDSYDTYEAAYVKFENVTIGATAFASRYLPFSDSEGNTINIYDTFQDGLANLTFDTSISYNISAYVARYNNTVQLYVLDEDDIEPLTDKTVPTAAWTIDGETVTKEDIYVGYTAEATFTTESDGEVTYSSADATIATVSENGVITGVAKGEVVITASVAETETYNAAERTITITVTEKPGGLETFENGSFEEWDGNYPVGWHSTTSASNHTITKSEVYYDGQYSAQIPHSSSSNNRLASKELLLPAGTYDISFYAKPATDDSFPMIEFGYAPWDAEKDAMGTYQYITVDGSNQITLSSNDWTEYTGSFTLTDETQVNLVIMCHQNGAGDVLIDLYSIKATTGSFTITEAGYATYYIEDAYVMPEGVTGTTVTGVEDTAMTDGGYLLKTAWSYTAGTTVPAKTALVFKGEAGTYTYTITSTDATAPTDNLLLGSTTETETTGPNGETTGYVFYELTNGSSGIGFYYGTGNGAAFTSAANKAWLALTTEQARGAKFLGFGDGDTTGITSVENEAKTVKGIYTLQGVKVSNMSQPGLYIVDGKKVIKR